MCVPLAVEAYGCWGPEAQTNLSQLAARLAIRSNCCKSQATLALYGRLNLDLLERMPELCCPVRWQLDVSRFTFSVTVYRFLCSNIV